jgi:hypothetical protein
MPRKSPFLIDLTEDERARLESVARQYTSPYCDVVRAKAILLAAQGLSNDEIGRHLGMPRQIVSKWRKRYSAEGMAGLHDRPRGGRPPSFSPSGGGGG